MQYVNMVCNHLGQRNHRMTQRECKETVDIMKKLIHEEVHCSFRAKVSTISLVCKKTWVSSSVLDSARTTLPILLTSNAMRISCIGFDNNIS